MAIHESETQVGWMLRDGSGRGEKIESLTQVVFGASVGMLSQREDVNITRQSGTHLDEFMRSPEGEFCEWQLLMATRVPASGMTRLRQDFAAVYEGVFANSFETFNVPRDLLEERRRIGLLVVPPEVSTQQELWVPEQYRIPGVQPVSI